MERSELTRRVKQEALSLGFDAVGVAPASRVPPEYLQTWLNCGYQGQMAYLERNPEKRLDPSQVLEGVRSVLSVVRNYLHPYPLPYGENDRGVISRYASGQDYHFVMERQLADLLRRIQLLSPGSRGKCYVDTGPLLEKYWAVRAGLGWLGKHSNVINRRLGSWFFIGEVLLDIELDYDEPETDHCGSCRLCIDACPTEAIVQPYVLDASRCISYLTIELRNEIPETFRGAMQNLIFGCDICQDVCPWNSKAPLSSTESFAPRPENREPKLADLAALSADEFAERFRRSPLKRPKWRGLLRNVTVAMGNSGRPAFIPLLARLLRGEDEMLRRHAAWALKEIKTRRALELLRHQIDRESDHPTRAVLQRYLQEATRGAAEGRSKA